MQKTPNRSRNKSLNQQRVKLRQETAKHFMLLQGKEVRSVWNLRQTFLLVSIVRSLKKFPTNAKGITKLYNSIVEQYKEFGKRKKEAQVQAKLVKIRPLFKKS